MTRVDQPPAFLFEMMRSFATLARTLNLSQAERELGTTRQTLRRHINLLEDYKGGPLFDLTERQYRLTPLGRDSLAEANALLTRVDAWLHNETGEQDGLAHRQIQDGACSFLLQQHPLSQIWQGGAPLLQWGLELWTLAKGQLESPELAPLRPHLRVFRPVDERWICTDVGAQSAFAGFFGWTWERSCIGRAITDLPGGHGFARLMADPFADVRANRGVRFDHLFAQFPAQGDIPQRTLSAHQLLMGCSLPDNSFALASLEHRTHDIAIRGLPEAMRTEMAADMVMPHLDPTAP